MNPYYWIIPAYLLGSFPTGVVLSRQKYGIDVREMGSGNIGATNVTRVFGWYAGVLVFLIDLFKALFPMLLVRRHYPDEEWLLAGVGAAIVLGHCFSIFLKFRGGKGVATSLGCVLIVEPWLGIVGAIVYAALLIRTKISAVGSLGGIAVVVLYAAIAQPPLPTTALLIGTGLIVTIRHHSNIRRLVDGWRGR